MSTFGMFEGNRLSDSGKAMLRTRVDQAYADARALVESGEAADEAEAMEIVKARWKASNEAMQRDIDAQYGELLETWRTRLEEEQSKSEPDQDTIDFYVRQIAWTEQQISKPLRGQSDG